MEDATRPTLVADSDTGRFYDDTLNQIADLLAQAAELRAEATSLVDVLCADVRDGADRLRPNDQLDLWNRVRALPLPGSTSRVVDAIGVSQHELSSWNQFGSPQVDPYYEGSFPITPGIHTPRKGVPCVYLLWEVFAGIVYIGRSEHVRARLKKHWDEQRADFSTWEIVTCETKADSIATEKKLIEHFRPRLNKTSNPDWNGQ